MSVTGCVWQNIRSNNMHLKGKTGQKGSLALEFTAAKMMDETKA